MSSTTEQLYQDLQEFKNYVVSELSFQDEFSKEKTKSSKIFLVFKVLLVFFSKLLVGAFMNKPGEISTPVTFIELVQMPPSFGLQHYL